jgi:hypothetical protein
MKTYTTHCLLLVLSVISHLSLFAQESVFDPGIDNSEKLPLLRIYVDNEDLAATYLHREVINSKEFEGQELSGQVESSIFYEDKKVLDARNVLVHYLDKDLVSRKGDARGDIEMKVTYYDYDHGLSIFGFLNVVTFGVTSLLGVPTFSGKTMVEVDLEIFDDNQQSIARYTANGRNRHFTGLFYNRVDRRESNLRALKDAVGNLNEMVMADYDEIVVALSGRDKITN